jgi:hypothetical protein
VFGDSHLGRRILGSNCSNRRSFCRKHACAALLSAHVDKEELAAVPKLEAVLEWAARGAHEWEGKGRQGGKRDEARKPPSILKKEGLWIGDGELVPREEIGAEHD